MKVENEPALSRCKSSRRVRVEILVGFPTMSKRRIDFTQLIALLLMVFALGLVSTNAQGRLESQHEATARIAKLASMMPSAILGTGTLQEAEERARLKALSEEIEAIRNITQRTCGSRRR